MSEKELPEFAVCPRDLRRRDGTRPCRAIDIATEVKPLGHVLCGCATHGTRWLCKRLPEGVLAMPGKSKCKAAVAWTDQSDYKLWPNYRVDVEGAACSEEEFRKALGSPPGPQQTSARDSLVSRKATSIASMKTEKPWQGPDGKKPWEYRVTAVIPHRNTPEHLELCLQFLQQQTERPYVMVIDTGSDDASLQRVLALRSESVEIHQIACHGTEDRADAVCYAMDLAMSACRTEYLWCVHSDCFVINRNLLAELLAKSEGGKQPVIGYESVSANKYPECKGMVSHTCTLLHMPTMDRLDVTWSNRRLQQQMKDAGRDAVADVEMALNYRLRDRGVTPLILGTEQTQGVERDANRVHLRSATLGADLMAAQPGANTGKQDVLKELRAMICVNVSTPRETAATESGIETFNLLYFIAPFANSDVWRWNVRELKKRLPLFNGRRIVAIATGKEMSPIEEVMHEFAGHRVRFIVDENDPSAGESAMFGDMLSLVQSTDSSEATFYAHAKGVSKPVDESVRKWTNWMYEYCLDDIAAIRTALASHACAGAFKTITGSPPENFPGRYSLWHFSGTFFWFRNAALFSRHNWRDVDRHFWGTEAYLSKLFTPDEAYCFFGETERPGAMYDPEFIRTVAMPEHERRVTIRVFQNYVDASATQDVTQIANVRYFTSLTTLTQPC